MQSHTRQREREKERGNDGEKLTVEGYLDNKIAINKVLYKHFDNYSK